MNRLTFKKMLFATSALCLLSHECLAADSCEPAIQICAVGTPIGGGLGCISLCREPREPKEMNPPRENWEPRIPIFPGRSQINKTQAPVPFNDKEQNL